MQSFYLGLIVIAAAGLLPAATISTDAFCAGFNATGPVTHNGGGPESPHADCTSFILDRGLLRANTATADVFYADVVASYSAYRFAPLDVSASGSLFDTFTVTFSGGSGFGLFLPCATVAVTGGSASATATVNNSIIIPGFPSANTSIGVLANTGTTGEVNFQSICNLPFGSGTFRMIFGQPVTLTIDLHAFATDFGELAGHNPDGRSEAKFLFSFLVDQVTYDPNGRILLTPLPGATWDLQAPEPSTLVLVLGVLLVLVARARALTLHR